MKKSCILLVLLLIPSIASSANLSIIVNAEFGNFKVCIAPMENKKNKEYFNFTTDITNNLFTVTDIPFELVQVGVILLNKSLILVNENVNINHVLPTFLEVEEVDSDNWQLIPVGQSKFFKEQRMRDAKRIR